MLQQAPLGCNHNGVGICHFSDNHWIQMANSSHKITMVSHSPHTLDVVYTAGASCAGGSTWLIVIRLYCSLHQSSEKPILKSAGNCEMQFDWPVSSLCISKTEVLFIVHT